METDTGRRLQTMQHYGTRALLGSARASFETKKKLLPSTIVFPFASVSVLVILLSLFIMSFEWGGWGWPTCTYAFSFVILAPLILLECNRKATITGGGFVILILMVLIDAGMPRHFGYTLADYNLYDKFAHYAGAAGITLFLWSVVWWTVSPSGPQKTDSSKILLITVVVMAVVSMLFKFAECMGDSLFGFANTHGYIDTVSDFIFNIAGIAAAAVVIKRHNYSVIKRPFWYAEP